MRIIEKLKQVTAAALAGKRWLITLSVLISGMAILIGGYRHFAPVEVAGNWEYRVFKDGIERVSALAIMDDSSIFATQEFHSGSGTLIRFNVDGTQTRILEQLSKPDGLVTFKNTLLVSQEQGEQPLLSLAEGNLSELFRAVNLEGIASDGTYLYGVEDLPQGRLLRFDPASKKLKVLRSGLHEAEGICVSSDGRVFYTEKGLGSVKQWNPAGEDRVVLTGLIAPGFLHWGDAGLWITEDTTHGARLLLLKENGSLQVVLKHLRSAQTLLPLANGRFLLAEQGRNRILELIPSNPEAKRS